MGQKTNPIIFKLTNTHTKTWESNYFEKKTTESALNNFKDLEIRKFIRKFFDYNGLTIHELKISYFNNVLHIFISYFATLKTVSLINTDNKKEKIKITAKYRNNNPQKHIQIKKNSKKYVQYSELNYLKKLKKKKNYISNEKKKILKLRRIKFLKYYKNYLSTQKYKNFSNINNNSFLNKFFESLVKFTNNKITISLTLNKLNISIKQAITKNKLKSLKTHLAKLSIYEQNKFFKEGLNILFLVVTQKNSAKLLSQFISTHLKKPKQHNFFLKFVKKTLTLFNAKTFSKLDGIKIKIKGRFNRAPRARYRIIEIGNKIPMLTIDSKIDYAETTAFSKNGTLGVKIWIYKKNVYAQ